MFAAMEMVGQKEHAPPEHAVEASVTVTVTDEPEVLARYRKLTREVAVVTEVEVAGTKAVGVYH